VVAVDAVAPAAVWADVETRLEVVGEGFVTPATVTVSGTPLEDVVVVHGGLVRGRLPVGTAPGRHAVTVASQGSVGSLGDALTVVAAPRLTSVSPDSRWSGEPHDVDGLGSGFLAAPLALVGVRVAGEEVLVEVVDDGRLHLRIPAATQVGVHDVALSREGAPDVVCAGCYTSTEVVVLSGEVGGLQDFPGRMVTFLGTVTVTPYNGVDETESCTAGRSGCLWVRAARVVLPEGTRLDARGAGWGGGGGGGGGYGMGGLGCGTAAAGGRGAVGGAAGQTAPLTSGCEGGGYGGRGGNGGGPAAGAGGGGGRGAPHLDGSGNENRCADAVPATAGGAGGHGGYAAAGVNGDLSTDGLVTMGSGGGGGGGGGGDQHYCANHNFSGGCGGGGGAAGRGGGSVTLEATHSLEVLGTVDTRGTQDGGNGGTGREYSQVCRYDFRTGGTGGNAAVRGNSNGGGGTYSARSGSGECSLGQDQLNAQPGGRGGAGAGGGVALLAPWVVLVGQVDARGGHSQNGGTVKVFHGGPDLATDTVLAGRVLQAPWP
jgi:hypothetical protein